ncbi:MAG TPA: 1-deoxy-D-xylulose-5-phosphate reductoisomerase [Smithellaceae bacterium]|jgi:1-deoxy-D-xylulose-5-phosphate reductoisomerase|nr:1-deoxy-D-xylulose-5-phosphate reductoisomerase [Smithellaceae bacterium]MDD3258653.1 1-deoxy-D-xylulose-5-phosphate reductoisomerase [Smithellaceae bacterium]HOG11991.1 1-deoxy-D-xylulose-5-phosphate reductoisomerase [Smithellaceae bacterium]HOQ71192.1 1-deoxy-D-xylulose-5-phosphate reductoisomerase [Smithellaceae bacterium]HPL09189.1 1-deoxy-D-xylulose-5-phosphate reductoisomerase [Smithellaceae bacterium]
MKKITILGSTGSIGASALDVVRKNPNKFRVAALAAGRNVKLLARQALAFHPAAVSVRTPGDAKRLRGLLGPGGKIRVLCGEEGVREIAAHSAADIVLSAISGAAGLKPTLAAIEAGKDIALANKETMVIAGHLVTKKAEQKKIRVLPVDSEHSAIFQCLAGQKPANIKRIILTASGGPFYSFSRADLKKVTPAQALRHPRWKMGAKITVDSASLMNKGLEVIEAKWLFDIAVSRIDVLIHPQSVVHSALELLDGSVLAQMGIADMRIPIAYALSFPDRMTNDLPALDLAKAGPLSFFPPDTKKFPCLRLALEAARIGGTAPAVLNAANEEAVAAFLENKICFHEIPNVIEKTLERHSAIPDPSLEEILLADGEARKVAAGILKKRKRG